MAEALTTVLGGSGFLGRTLVRRLAAAGYRVRTAARGPQGAVHDGDVETLRCDVRDPGSVEVAVQGAVLVVNAVGLYLERGRETFDAVHVAGAANVAAAAQRAGARLVHISGIGADAHSPSRYVRARAEGEARVLAAAPNAVILRPSVLFGPDDALLSTLDKLTRYLPVVPLFGAGATRLQPVFVGDVAEAVLRVAAGSADDGAVYELGGPVQYRYRDLIAEVLTYRQRRRVLLPVPFIVWELQSACLAVLPSPPLTRDQVILMRNHNVVGEDARGFAALGIEPRALAALLPECLPAVADHAAGSPR